MLLYSWNKLNLLQLLVMVNHISHWAIFHTIQLDSELWENWNLKALNAVSEILHNLVHQMFGHVSYLFPYFNNRCRDRSWAHRFNAVDGGTPAQWAKIICDDITVDRWGVLPYIYSMFISLPAFKICKFPFFALNTSCLN